MIALLSVALASAEPPPFLQGPPANVGVGLQVGTLSGIALAFRPGGDLYFQSGINWSLTDDRLGVDGDVLWTLTELVIPDAPLLRFPVYFGAGGRVRINQKNAALPDHTLGVRVPIGMALAPTNTSIDTFIELAPVLLVYPDIDVGMDFTLGIRMYPLSR
ncbi:MAG: hypothetical protein ACI8RZ_001579 [Myxococcota bacterium]